MVTKAQLIAEVAGLRRDVAELIGRVSLLEPPHGSRPDPADPRSTRLLPDGWYNARIVDVVRRQSMSGRKYRSVEFVVVGDQWAGRKLWWVCVDHLPTPFEQMASKLDVRLPTRDVEVEHPQEKIDKLIDRYVRVRVKTSNYGNTDRNEVAEVDVP